MKDFWKNEWNLFLNDMQELGEFFMQPVTFGRSNQAQMLRPTAQEVQFKAQTDNNQGFWSREWNAFLMDMQNVGEFFLQPVEFTSKPTQEARDIFADSNEMNIGVKNEAASVGFWTNEWNLFKQDLRNAKDFLTQPINFK